MRAEQQSAPQHPGEEGFLLLAAVAMVAIILVALAVAAPVIAKDLRRDKEVESTHRAQQYVRAIRLYQRKFPNQYPASIEALEKSNNIRFLRKQYVDPLTGKADWRMIHVGENKTKVSVFFGEPLGGLSSGIGGNNLGSAAGLASGAQVGTSAGGSNPAQAGPVNALAGGFSGASAGGGGATAAGAPAASGTQSGSGFGNGGAGPIMGIGSSRTGESILVVNEQDSYETWEFLYDPRIELLYKKGQLGGGPSSTAASAFGSSATSDKTNTGGANPLGNGATPGPTTPTPRPR